MSKNSLSRRDMIKMLGIAGISTSFLGKMGFIPEVSAASNSDVKNFLMFQLFGAPSRWTWVPLAPYESTSNMVSNPNVITKLIDTSGNYESGEYKTININGVNMPWIWQFDLPTSDGGSRPMSDLMDDMMIFQGVNVGNPAHSGASELQFFPSGINHSLTSLNGDVTNFPIPFVGMRTSPNRPYVSKVNKTGVDSLSMSGNLLDNLLSPFNINVSTSFKDQLSLVQNNKKTEIGLFNTTSLETNKKLQKTIDSDKSASSILQKNIASMSSQFSALKNKYIDLLKRACAPMPISGDSVTNLVGINDKPVMVNGVDIRETLKTKQGTSIINRLADEFAVIEFCFVNKLTSSIAVGLASFSGFTFDEHTVNCVSACYTNSLWNRGFAACLLELSDVLKQHNMWDDTIIQVNGEFGRTPKNTGTGSDHALDVEFTYFGGSLDGNTFSGNTLRESTRTNYLGTWGEGATNEGHGRITIAHMAATLASFLNVESPITSASTLVEKNSNGIYTSKLNKTKLV